MVATRAPMRQLELIKEAKIADIVEGLDPRLEASGVLASDGVFYVIFDNLAHIARIGAGLSPTAPANHVIRQDKGHSHGFEDIVHDSSSGRFYVLIESLPRGRGTFMAKVQEYNAGFGYLDSAWLDFPLDRPNKGLEGLACVRRDGQTHLLGLCEGNRCEGGAEGRIPGGGRIQVFRRPPPLGPRGQDPAARDGPLRGLQRYRRERRSGRGCVPGLFGAVGRQPCAIKLGGNGRGHDLRIAPGCRRRDRLRYGRGRVVGNPRRGCHGLRQGQAGPGPKVPGKGSVDSHLPYPFRALS
jgi:hypothetical protein